jgi:bile acid-coenzyme A ligase
LSAEPITYTERIRELAEGDPGGVALIVAGSDGSDVHFTRRELLEDSLRAASLLENFGVDGQSLVDVALPNGIDHVVACLGAWWLGACVLPLSPALPPAELKLILASAAEAGRSQLLVGDYADVPVNVVTRSALSGRGSFEARSRPTVIPNPGRAVPSGGSTGRPKIIVSVSPMVVTPSAPPHPMSVLFGSRPGQRQIVLGPTYHTGPFSSLFGGLADGALVVLMERFEAKQALELIERYRVNRLFSVPAQLLRMVRVEGFEEYDLSSLETLYHSGALCPPWLKRRWIERLGPERVFEGFGSTETVGALAIRGDEWLRHPGSVGRPQITDVSIRNEDGEECPVGEVGEVFMRWKSAEEIGAEPPSAGFVYWGSPPAKSDSAGYTSVGDLGWMDADGYLHIADRRVDMIITGGVNVFPAEVEAAITEHPGVADVAVIGVPDPDWGRRVHAIIEPAPGIDGVALLVELREMCRSRMAAPKVPKSYDLVDKLPRDENGKIRRSAITAAASALQSKDQ